MLKVALDTINLSQTYVNDAVFLIWYILVTISSSSQMSLPRMSHFPLILYNFYILLNVFASLLCMKYLLLNIKKTTIKILSLCRDYNVSILSLRTLELFVFQILTKEVITRQASGLQFPLLYILILDINLFCFTVF
jgi:hypothetical protein